MDHHQKIFRKSGWKAAHQARHRLTVQTSPTWPISKAPQKRTNWNWTKIKIWPKSISYFKGQLSRLENRSRNAQFPHYTAVLGVMWNVVCAMENHPLSSKPINLSHVK